MVFKIDFHDDDAVIEWCRSADGVTRHRVPGYTRTIYVEGPLDARSALRSWLDGQSGIVETTAVERFTSLRATDRSELLAISMTHTTDPRTVARRIRSEVELKRCAPGTLRLYNVDLAPQFRYCLDNETDPTPTEALRTLPITVDEPSIADRCVSEATINDESIAGSERQVLETLVAALEQLDPDVLIINDSALVPLLHERALAHGIDLQLGREPGWTKLAGQNTFESYGQVGYSAARYDVPGRVLLDTGNSFLWAESSLAGLLYLVEQSHKPLQETAWGSIGNILTSIQILEATDREVVIPWNKWEPERFKDVTTLHAADRGGFIMDPSVGFHEGVYELDFSSLYPYIMCEYNISPDTILCDCHADRADIPGLNYHVCDKRGFIAAVLEPLLEDRETAKAAIRAAEDDAQVNDERAIAGAIKWVLVSCFGYQGYRNSKFGRIECHEAINAVARDIFLHSKAVLEAGGWRVVHGIVDSIWVTPREDCAQTPIDTLVATITDDVGIQLEREARYEWVMFVPRRGTDRGALTKYVAKREDDGFKLRGIEARQRSTCPFVADAQRELLSVLDEHREPAPVIDRLETQCRALHTGSVEPADLVITRRVSKPLAEYQAETLTVAALRRAKRAGVAKYPGQSVRFVVTDDNARRTAERLRLSFEPIEEYDATYYEERLLRAAESVVAPLGWDRDRIDRYRRKTVDARLGAFG